MSCSVNININSKFLNIDVDLTVNCEEQVFVMEVTISGSSHVGCFEVGTVVSMVEINIDVLNIGLWNIKNKVLKITSIEIDLWDFHVLDDVEDVWGDDVFSLTDTFLGD